VDDFYAARSGSIPPLPWSNFAPPFSPGINVHVAGVVVSASVLLDQWLSNHARMIVYTIAEQAVKRTLRRVKDEYSDQIVTVVRLANENGREVEANQMLTELASRSSRILRTEMDRIHTAVEEANLEFLRALNVDQQTQTHLPPPPSPGPS
jgi:hypothetical protein